MATAQAYLHQLSIHTSCCQIEVKWSVHAGAKGSRIRSSGWNLHIPQFPRTQEAANLRRRLQQELKPWLTASYHARKNIQATFCQSQVTDKSPNPAKHMDQEIWPLRGQERCPCLPSQVVDQVIFPAIYSSEWNVPWEDQSWSLSEGQRPKHFSTNDRMIHPGRYRTRKESCMWVQRPEPQWGPTGWAFLHQWHFDKVWNIQESRGSSNVRARARDPAKAEDSSLQSTVSVLQVL